MESDDPVQEGARSWIVAACCCFCNLTFYGVSRLSGMMLVATTQTFHVSRASAALPFSMSTAVRNLAGVFVGHLGHRFGVGPVVATGCVIASVGSCLCFFAKDMLWLTVCWGGVFGFGFGLCTCLLPLAINQNFSKHLGTASGISYSGSYIGSFIFPPVVVWLLEAYSLQGTFLIISGGVLNVLVAALLLREPASKRRKKIVGKDSEDVISTISKDQDKSTIVDAYYTDVSELWRKNICRAYMTSQDELLTLENNYKQNYRHSIAFANSPYIQQYPSYREIIPDGGNSISGTCFCRNNLQSEMSSYHCNLLPKLFKTFNNKNAWTAECDKASAIQNSSYSVHSSIDSSLPYHLHSTQCFDDCSANKHDSLTASAKQVPTMFRGCPKKSQERKPLFKINLKAKYKLKLQKLKNVLITSFIKQRSPYLKEFVQSENVQLTSFRYLQPFLNLSDANVSLATKSLRAPSSQRRKSTVFKVINNPKSCVSFQRCGLKVRERCNSLPISALNGEQEFEPVLYGTVLNRTMFGPFVKKSPEPRINLSNCDVSANKTQYHSCLFLPTKENKNIISRNVGYTTDFTPAPDNQVSSDKALSLSPELLLNDKTEFKEQKRKSSNSHLKSSGSESCFLDWLYMLREPVFIIIGFTMSIQTFIVVCFVTTIEDYARDIGVPENQTYYALMASSIANLVGTLTMGSITDRGLISRHRFMFLCFLGMSASLVSVSLFAASLPSLLSLVVLYGLLESGVIITFPLLTKQFIAGEKRQAVAIASSNVLSVPTVMLVPMLIGHFRDNIGSYTGLFQLLGATSLTCSLLWLVAPSVCKKRNLRKASQENKEIC